ncbi:hypothetical protein GPJ56_010276 [Histomonas meleagridis]|uniref:uncharacterized protein n=1 Tax=Histomonas meleagridis TaxID=135588 RepID=UPI0035597F21|nr:hypothetical protein GPJ56_010276 [Histomonas meleagridis]KAH0797145.1 hypothetical protein GO595_011038 [Histomonas meleagridis]
MIQEKNPNGNKMFGQMGGTFSGGDEIEEFQIQINKLSIPEESINALSFFRDYLEGDLLPPEIFVQLHNFILRIIQAPGIPQPNLDLVLNILTEIAEFLNEDIDFAGLTNHLLQYLPIESAFEAISTIASCYITSARFLISALPNILQFLSADSNQQHGYLLIILSILNHKVLVPDMVGYINAIFGVILSGNAEHLSICFSILAKFANSEIGFSQIEEFSHISQIFDHYRDNPECIIPIIQFLDSICSSKTQNPMKFIELTNSASIIINAMTTNDQKVLKVLCQLLYTLSRSEQGMDFLFKNEIVDNLFYLFENSSFSISSKALKILCSVCSNCPHEVVMNFIAKGFLELIINYIADAPVDLLKEILTAVQTIVLAIKSSGDQSLLEKIEDSELMDEIYNVSQNNHDNTIGVIASFICDNLSS